MSNTGKIRGNPIYRRSINGFLAITYNQFELGVNKYKLYRLFHYHLDDGNYREQWDYVTSGSSIGLLSDYMNKCFDGRMEK